ncbi:hypothetical protein [Flammeovirga sp. EKP202]|uniref:hypothetical protein n=1 Tax=Flammeovirga sp. EKP202 TaxID=2770592 RepID=UPI00165FA76B|nr:hypothetical protein [Flammeovirga sp. EKP202]MBD0403242.1 hypothetical protein [Flammeovirga sp. EKP202]
MTNVNNGAFTFLGQNIQIDPSWDNVFNNNITLLKDAEDELLKLNKSNKIFYPYDPKNIFKVFSMSLKSIKVVLIGQDPYYDSDIATGLAFDIDEPDEWGTDVPPSLTNIARELYYIQNNKSIDTSSLREKISESDFIISSPNKICKKWRDNGVFLINTALTVKKI